MKALILGRLQRHRPFLITTVAVFAAALIVHFWPVLLSPATVLYGGPGDHTAGLIWLYDQYNKTPWWRFSHNTAIPWGESVWDPSYILGQINYLYYWLVSKVSGGSVTGFNLFAFTGLGLSFFITAAFVYRRIIRQPLVAALAGYFAAFTTMVLGKLTSGYIAFLYGAAYVVGAVWLLTDLLQGRTPRRNAILLGLLVGSLFYFDPYYVLIIPVVLLAALLGLVIHSGPKAVITRRLFQALALAVPIAGLIAATVAAYLHFWPSPGLVGRSGVDMTVDAAQYGAILTDYFTPSPFNPLFPSSLVQLRLNTHHGADPSYVLFLGYSLIAALITVWSLLLYHAVIRRRQSVRQHPAVKYFAAFTAVAVVAFYFSLAARYQLHGFRLYTPADLLTSLTYAWRVFANFDAAVHPALIISLLTGGLVLYQTVLRRRWLIVTAGLLAVVLGLETLPRNPLSTGQFWNYQTSLPATYHTIKARPASSILAEYPLRDQPHYRGSLYLTAQHYHGKRLLNAYSSGSPTGWYRESLFDLTSPQTLPVLRALGVDTLQVNWSRRQYQQPFAIPGRRLATTDYTSKFGHDFIELYDISQGPADRYMVIINRNQRPRNEDLVDGIRYQLSPDDTLEVVDLCGLHLPVNLDCRQTVTARAIQFTTHSREQTLSVTREGRPQTLAAQSISEGTPVSIPLGPSPAGKYVLHSGGDFEIGQLFIDQ